MSYNQLLILGHLSTFSKNSACAYMEIGSSKKFLRQLFSLCFRTVSYMLPLSTNAKGTRNKIQTPLYRHRLRETFGPMNKMFT